jgi:hypothetical protein
MSLKLTDPDRSGPILISVGQIRSWNACAADLARHLGRPVTDQDGLSIEGWAKVRTVNGKPTVTTPDLAYEMIRQDYRRWMEPMAAVLEAILSPDADPRSLAIIPALRSGVVTKALRTAACEAAAATMTGADDESSEAWTAWLLATGAKNDDESFAVWQADVASDEAAGKAKGNAEVAWILAEVACSAALAAVSAEKWEQSIAGQCATDAAEQAERVCPHLDIRGILLRGWAMPGVQNKPRPSATG